MTSTEFHAIVRQTLCIEASLVSRWFSRAGPKCSWLPVLLPPVGEQLRGEGEGM